MTRGIEQNWANPTVNIGLCAPQNMTLRDFFAAAVLTGLCARPGEEIPADPFFTAYDWADAMLAERSKEGGGS